MMRTAILVAIAAVLAPTAARACASCGCGDPTLTAMGIEKPYKNRVRLGLETLVGAATMGAGDGAEESWTWRSSLLASWSVDKRLSFYARLPVVAVWTQMGDLPQHHGVGLGDAELSSRVVVWRDAGWSPHHIVSLLGGIKMPTGPRAYDETGFPLADDIQPGSGSWDPFAGASWGWFNGSWTTYASVSYRYTTTGWDGYRRGSSLGGTVGLQLQPMDTLAVSLAVDGRWAAADTTPVSRATVDVPNSGGGMLAVTPSLLWSPRPDWLVKLSVQVHAYDWLDGVQSQSSVVLLSTVVDLN